jgi:hypothetical protein
VRRKRPRSLFRYLNFSDRLLQQLCAGEVHYSDPSTFNDPLDCRPIVKVDVLDTELKQVLAELVIRRAGREVDIAIKKLRLRGENVAVKRQALTESEVRAIIGDIEYQATNPEVSDSGTYIRFAVAQAIEVELRKAYDLGVLCLSERFDSPLMWSHYGQQHRGVCIEYDVSQVRSADIRRVEYGRSREVDASAIQSWLQVDDPAARLSIERACLLRKSKEWNYEREWRMLGPVGSRSSPIEVKAIIFGIRCPTALQYTIVKVLGGSTSAVKFWEMRSPGARFELRRERVDIEELMVAMPLRSVVLDFEDLGAGGSQDNAR